MIRELWQKARVESVSDGHQEPEPVPETLHAGTWYDDAEEPAGHSLNVRAGIPAHGLNGCPTSVSMLHRRPVATSCRPNTSSTGSTPSTPYGRSALGDRISPHLHATEIRTAASDELWLSPAYERDSLCIGFTWRKHPTEVM